MIIRRAVDGDFSAIGEVDSAARWHAYDGVLPAEQLAEVTPAARSAFWAELASREAETHQLLVAERDGRVVGYTYVGPGEDPRLGDLYALFVDPSAHGTGVAAPLMFAGLDVLRRMGYSSYLLFVHKDNRQAVRFYAKHGWSADLPPDGDYLRLTRAAEGEIAADGRDRGVDGG